MVTTKLPMTGGHARDTLIATGSTTTRLLGTFQAVEHVFIVGAGGGVPHFTDFDRHVRLGDVVVSAPSPQAFEGQKSYVYQYCEKIHFDGDDQVRFETRSWCPPDLGLQHIAGDLVERYQSESSAAPWLDYFVQGLNEGGFDETWTRPSSDSDKLYMSVGGGDVIEVGHPMPREAHRVDPRALGEPVVQVGPIGSGRRVAGDERLRQEFAARFGTLAFDGEFDAVVESVFGNRKDQYMMIRGICDYQDGSQGQTRREWQQYSALMAASVLRAIVEQMPTI